MDEKLTEEELGEVSFCDNNWVNVFGLSAFNALEYFATSPFYDVNCDNEHLRTQNRPPEVLKDMLLQMKGVQYALVQTQQEPRLFVVVKQHRKSPSHAPRQAIFYILDKVVYRAPTLQRLIWSRLLKSSTHLNNAFTMLEASSRCSPAQGYTWHFPGEAHKAWRESIEGATYEMRRKQRDDRLERHGEDQINAILGGLHTQFVDADADADADAPTSSSSSSSSSS